MDIPTWESCRDKYKTREPLNPLEEFIRDNEPMKDSGEDIFREGLQKAVDFLEQEFRG